MRLSGSQKQGAEESELCSGRKAREKEYGLREELLSPSCAPASLSHQDRCCWPYCRQLLLRVLLQVCGPPWGGGQVAGPPHPVSGRCDPCGPEGHAQDLETGWVRVSVREGHRLGFASRILGREVRRSEPRVPGYWDSGASSGGAPAQ